MKTEDLRGKLRVQLWPKHTTDIQMEEERTEFGYKSLEIQERGLRWTRKFGIVISTGGVHSHEARCTQQVMVVDREDKGPEN